MSKLRKHTCSEPSLLVLDAKHAECILIIAIPQGPCLGKASKCLSNCLFKLPSNCALNCLSSNCRFKLHIELPKLPIKLPKTAYSIANQITKLLRIQRSHQGHYGLFKSQYGLFQRPYWPSRKATTAFQRPLRPFQMPQFL